MARSGAKKCVGGWSRFTHFRARMRASSATFGQEQSHVPALANRCRCHRIGGCGKALIRLPFESLRSPVKNVADLRLSAARLRVRKSSLTKELSRKARASVRGLATQLMAITSRLRLKLDA